MVKVYGYSDDVIVLDGAPPRFDEIGGFRQAAEIEFTDGTVIRCQYGKGDLGIWAITVKNVGSAPHTLTICEDEDATPYSDVFTIDAEVSGFSFEIFKTTIKEGAKHGN